jgi:hypothetical protein
MIILSLYTKKTMKIFKKIVETEIISLKTWKIIDDSST